MTVFRFRTPDARRNPCTGHRGNLNDILAEPVFQRR